MKSVRFFSLLALLSLVTLSCSDSPASGNNGNNHTVLPKPGKTIIVDVRTTEEWNNDGHADCTVNYPLDELSTKIETLQAFDKIIVVCRSGRRANAAKDLLKQAGFNDVEYKGAWQNIDCN